MSAAPFGGHPTFGQYLAWAGKVAGCAIKQGIVHGPDQPPQEYIATHLATVQMRLKQAGVRLAALLNDLLG